MGIKKDMLLYKYQKNRVILVFTCTLLYILYSLLSYSVILGESSKIRYTIKKGDTLSKISQKYNISIRNIQAWNKIKNPNNIHVNQKLTIYPSLNKSTPKHLNLQSKIPIFYQPTQSTSVIKHYQSHGDNKVLGLIYHYSSENIYPAAKGTIIEKGYLRGYGNYIIIDHGQGWLTMYSLLDEIFLKRNAHVTRSSRLGSSKNKKLFFSLSYKGKPVNPTLHLQRNQKHTIG